MSASIAQACGKKCAIVFITGGKTSSGTMHPPSAASTSPRKTPIAPACEAFCKTDPITIAAPVAASANSKHDESRSSAGSPIRPGTARTVPTTIKQPLDQARSRTGRASRRPGSCAPMSGVASIRRVTPKRRVSISIDEADSDVRNMNRITSCAAPVANKSRPRIAAGRARRHVDGSQGRRDRSRPTESLGEGRMRRPRPRRTAPHGPLRSGRPPRPRPLVAAPGSRSVAP